MADLPHPWRIYADNQRELDRRSSADSAAWGLEAGLDALLDGSTTSDTVSRTIANASRRSRYASALLAKYVRTGRAFDGVAYLEVRSALQVIGQHLSADQVSTLWRAVTAAASAGPASGAERTRIARARSAARCLAA